jgi:hypothetical protein
LCVAGVLVVVDDVEEKSEDDGVVDYFVNVVYGVSLNHLLVHQLNVVVLNVNDEILVVVHDAAAVVDFDVYACDDLDYPIGRILTDIIDIDMVFHHYEHAYV